MFVYAKGTTMSSSDQEIREHVRDRYAAAALAVVSGSAASCCGPSEGAQTSCCGPSDALTAISDTEEGDIFGAALYTPGETDGLPEEAVLASLGCGNPLAVADLREGERVLDLGSGGGIDVLLSARRVGSTGFAYGLDMTDEMLDLARANAVKAGAANVEFVKGQIEDIPLPDGSIDVVISNCVINLSTDKPAVLAEMFRVLTPGGRLGISDVVADDGLSPADRAERGSYVGCIAGALSRSEYLDGLTAAGFIDPEVVFTHEAAPGMHGAIIRAVKPAYPVGDKPAVLFVCVHNAGRSQMAAGYLTALSRDRIEVRSAGSLPGEQVNPVAIEAMAEEGIDISAQTPKVLTAESVQAADVVITMGCGDACPIFPGKRYEDWDLEDPAGKDIDTVRRVRDDIRGRVLSLMAELLPAGDLIPGASVEV